MNKSILTSAFLFIALMASAQKYAVKGKVMDNASVTMPSATVMILNPKDSSLVNFGVTNSAGWFEIKNVSKGEYQLKISFVGYAPFLKSFSTPDNTNVVDLGDLVLQPQSQELSDVVVKGERNPVTVKRDTIEFNAGSFKTKANANVEDLLKKMPGIEVESDGTINAQGEQVQQVTVDGREFFGRDPKLATRNLPADAVDKVQVYDKKSDQAVFTGIEDGQKAKTINLELKEEKRNAAFGNLMAGYGTNDRYQAKASINKFNKGRQLSFIGMGNNVNEQGFSVGEAMNFSGGGQSFGGGGGAMTIQIGGGGNNGVPMNFGGRQNGVMTNWAGGVNFNQDLNKNKTQLGGNYFYSWLEQNIVDTLTREYLQPANFFNQGSRQLSNSESHRVNLTLDSKIDSANSIKFTSNMSYSNSEQNSNLTSETKDGSGNTIGTSSSNAMSMVESGSTSNNLLWRHRFAKKGRSFSANINFDYSQSNNETDQQTLTQTQSIGEYSANQINKQDSKNTMAGASLSYIEPLGNRKYLEINYNYRTNINNLDRNSFSGDTGSSIDSLNNNYRSKYDYNKPSLNFRINRQKFNFSFGTAYQYTTLRGDLYTADTVINRSFNRFLPVAHFNYDFSSFRHLRLDYEASMQEPTIRQLQPFFEPSNDQINFYRGNPLLRPSKVQSVNLHFTSFDPAKFVSLFLFGRLAYQTDAIVNSQIQVIDKGQLKRFTQPMNVRNALNANANLNFGFRVTKLMSRFNVGANITENKSINLLSSIGDPTLQEVSINTEALGGNVRYNFTYKDAFTLDLSANVRNSTSKYDNTQADQRYINSTYSAETNITIKKNWQVNADFNYYVYNSKTTDFNQSIPILNVWLSRFILKANAGEIKVGVSNLLDRSLSVTQTATANYLQQETMNNLGRYLMLSFTYALNRQLNPFGGGGRGPRGGMRMIMSN